MGARTIYIDDGRGVEDGALLEDTAGCSEPSMYEPTRLILALDVPRA